MNSQTLQVVVRRREHQGDNVVVLDLVSEDGSELPPFEAGAHVDVHLAPDLVRQYSLCGDPTRPGPYRLGVLRDQTSRGGSTAVHDHLLEGVKVAIGIPRNHFPLNADAEHSVLVGGGIGITPMLAMAYALCAAGRSFELHYSARSRSTSAFVAELTEGSLASNAFLHFSDEIPSNRLDLDTVLEEHAVEGTHVYVCGPVGLMDHVMDRARRHGLPTGQIHREYFGAALDSSGQGFDVIAAASGKCVHVAEGQTIMAALASIGIEVEASCQEGVCGTCVCTVLEGECDHRDVYLTDEERADNDQIMVCCSRAKSARLVLDV